MAVRAYLYDAEGRDREVALSESVLTSLGPQQLLWIDVSARDERRLADLAQQLGVDPQGIVSVGRAQTSRVENHGAYSQFSVLTPQAKAPENSNPSDSQDGGNDTEVTFVVDQHWLLTVHDGPIDFIDLFRSEDRPETMIGALTPQDFAASLLDAHLEKFFEEVAQIEAMVDRLDEQALISPSGNTILGRMVALRRRVSRLRSSLALQRGVFYGLSRPDLQVGGDSATTPHFKILVSRFERAIDEVEHARDLIVGSFDLFTSRTAQQTNELVKVLTYLTAIIGLCAAVAGVMGMNFQAAIFKSGDFGFYLTLVGLILVILLSALLAWLRKWL